MENRSDWVDYAKAIGIALVVYGHVARGIVKAGVPVDDSLFKIVDSVIYSFHMPLFFFLSGLFFVGSVGRRGWIGLTTNKIDTIIYPYIIWSLFQGFFEVAASKYTNGHVTIGEVLSFAWSPRAHFWFLYALFQIFFLISIFYVLLKTWKLSILFVICSALYLFSVYLPGFFDFMRFFSSYAIFFVFGAIFNRYMHLFIPIKRVFVSVFFVLFLLGQYYFHFVLNLDYNSGGLLLFALSMVSIFFVAFLSMCLKDIGLGWLVVVGEGSMVIYLIHVLFGSGVRVVLMKFLHINSLPIHLILGTAVALSFPLAVQLLFKRFKVNFMMTPPKVISATHLFLVK